MTNLEYRAREFAKEAHKGQVRKYTGDPYIIHPAAVVALVKSVRHTDIMLAAAWLHDVVEDTPVSLTDILMEFGSEVRFLVRDLTDVSIPSDGNRAARKQIDRYHTSMASPEAKTIKLADFIDNSLSIIKYGKDFTPIYMREKQLCLPYLIQGNRELWRMATTIVDSYYKIS